MIEGAAPSEDMLGKLAEPSGGKADEESVVLRLFSTVCDG
jgi:hypothetical protein